jgi:hypothetical protein
MKLVIDALSAVSATESDIISSEEEKPYMTNVLGVVQRQEGRNYCNRKW